MKRRLLLKSLGASAVAAPWLLRNANAAQTGAGQQDSETAELLFVQTAHAVELKDGVLRLSAVNPVTIFFPIARNASSVTSRPRILWPSGQSARIVFLPIPPMRPCRF